MELILFILWDDFYYRMSKILVTTVPQLNMMKLCECLNSQIVLITHGIISIPRTINWYLCFLSKLLIYYKYNIILMRNNIIRILCYILLLLIFNPHTFLNLPRAQWKLAAQIIKEKSISNIIIKKQYYCMEINFKIPFKYKMKSSRHYHFKIKLLQKYKNN